MKSRATEKAPANRTRFALRVALFALAAWTMVSSVHGKQRTDRNAETLNAFPRNKKPPLREASDWSMAAAAFSDFDDDGEVGWG